MIQIYQQKMTQKHIYNQAIFIGLCRYEGNTYNQLSYNLDVYFHAKQATVFFANIIKYYQLNYDRLTILGKHRTL